MTIAQRSTQTRRKGPLAGFAGAEITVDAALDEFEASRRAS